MYSCHLLAAPLCAVISLSANWKYITTSPPHQTHISFLNIPHSTWLIEVLPLARQTEPISFTTSELLPSCWSWSWPIYGRPEDCDGVLKSNYAQSNTHSWSSWSGHKLQTNACKLILHVQQKYSSSKFGQDVNQPHYIQSGISRMAAERNRLLLRPPL